MSDIDSGTVRDRFTHNKKGQTGETTECVAASLVDVHGIQEDR